jgi:hypothetical protein
MLIKVNLWGVQNKKLLGVPSKEKENHNKE